jgi:F-type H+-transporting ATPase subunit epsilon
MDDAFAVEVVTPEQTLLAGAATAVVLRTSDGTLTVLAGHAPLVGDVMPGLLSVERADETVVRMAVHGGFIQVDTGPEAAAGVADVGAGPIAGLSTRVTVLAGVAELAEDIDVERAERARGEAEARLDQPGGVPTEVELDQVTASLRRAEVRLEVAGQPGS